MESVTSEPIAVGALQIQFLVEPEHTDGSMSLFECVVPPSSKVPAPHSHDAFEETIYGLRGTTTWTVDGEVVHLSPGRVLRIRRGAVHGFDNSGDETARFLAIVTPGLFGPSYFHELAAVLAATTGPPDPVELAAVMRRHGLTPMAHD